MLNSVKNYMKTIKINLDESIYDKFISIIKSFPEEKITIFDEIDDSHIEYMGDDEKKEVLEILRDGDSKIMAKSKSVKI